VEAARTEIEAALGGGAASAGLNWFVEFAEVFADGNGGFDIVVANPPYVRQELIGDQKPALKAVFAEFYCGTADLCAYFYARAHQLLRQGGMLAFISSNKWLRTGYGANLRELMATRTHLSAIIDFRDLPVFQGIIAYPVIVIARKEAPPAGAAGPLHTAVPDLEEPYPDVRAVVRRHGRRLGREAVAGKQWLLADAAVSGRYRAMEASGPPLGRLIGGQVFRGVLTGLNEAFFIDGARRRELIERDPRSAEIIKPLLRGRDIRRWSPDAQDRWIIVTQIGVDMGRYPAIMEHLAPWEERLRARQDQGRHWWELRACAYYGEFDQPKIVYPDIAKRSRFAFDNTNIYVSNTAYIIPTEDMYLLGLLNSDPVEELYASMSSQVRGGYLRFIRQYVEQIPIPEASEADRAAIADLARRCVDARGVECEAWEREINARVEALYGL
jgi:hypothetical protein